MALMNRLMDWIFGGGTKAVADVAGVFRENTEAGAIRDHSTRTAAMAQFASEFGQPKRGLFNRFVDALNRLPRPMMALGVIALFVAAMSAPEWFAIRMQGLQLVPEPLWWLLGAVVSFYFGARHQLKGQEFQKSMATTFARAPEVIQQIRRIRDYLTPGEAEDDAPDVQLAIAGDLPATDNAAVLQWRQEAGRP